MEIILNLLAQILKWALAPIMFIINSFLSIKTNTFLSYNKQLALVKDQYGNVLMQYLLNWLLIKENGYLFGNRKETISSVLGKNLQRGTLKRLGKIFVSFLDLLEDNHCLKSIDEAV